MHYSLWLFKGSYEAYGKWVFLNKEGQIMHKLRLIFLFCKSSIFLHLMEPRVKNGFTNVVSDLRKKMPYWP